MAHYRNPHTVTLYKPPTYTENPHKNYIRESAFSRDIYTRFMYIHYDAMKLETFLWAEDKNAGFLNSTSNYISGFLRFRYNVCIFAWQKVKKLSNHWEAEVFFFQTADKARISLCSIIHSSLLLLSKIIWNQMLLSKVVIL